MHVNHQSPTLRLLILLTVAGAIFLLVSGRVSASTPESAPHVYQVQPGDTLWDLAAEVAGTQIDVRVVIADIKRMNDLDTSALLAGQTLLMPTR